METKVSPHTLALQDIKAGALNYRVWWMLAWQDVKKRYRRSVLGPLWITLSTGVMIALMGPIYSMLFNQNTGDYVKYLAVSFILWNFISGFVNEACGAFIESEDYIKQIKLPYTIYVIKTLVRNVIMFLHNFAIVLIIWLVYSFPGFLPILAFPFLFLITVFNLFNLGLILGLLCTRFRDVPIVISNLIFACFFLTPIFWKKEMLGARAFLADYNPLYLTIELVRRPLLGMMPSLYLIAVNLCFSLILAGFSYLMFSKFRSRISFWI